MAGAAPVHPHRPAAEGVNCPDCRALMTALTLDGHHGRPVAIDLCHACQTIWFDGYESLQLAPASVLRLFREVSDHAASRQPSASDAACPRCGGRLRVVKDQQRSTRFEYRTCPSRHGRLISFFNFLREKDFIRPMTPAQLAELRRHVQAVNCSNCGAPVDLTKGTGCAHCGSPLSMLDVKQAQGLVDALASQASAGRPVDPALALGLEKARRDVNAAFASFERQPGWFDDMARGGTVGAGIASFLRWLG